MTIQISGTYSYQIDPNTNTVRINVDRITNNSNTYTTGSLRLELWATTTPYGGGSVSGYRLAASPLTGSSNGQLGPNQYFYDVSHTAALAMTPPPGNY